MLCYRCNPVYNKDLIDFDFVFYIIFTYDLIGTEVKSWNGFNVGKMESIDS